MRLVGTGMCVPAKKKQLYVLYWFFFLAQRSHADSIGRYVQTKKREFRRKHTCRFHRCIMCGSSDTLGSLVPRLSGGDLIMRGC